MLVNASGMLGIRSSHLLVVLALSYAGCSSDSDTPGSAAGGSGAVTAGGASVGGKPAAAAGEAMSSGARAGTSTALGGSAAEGGQATGGVTTQAGSSASGGSSAGAASGGASAGGQTGGGPAPAVPTPPAACPTIASGTVSVLGQDVRIWTGPAGKTGPLVFYWHGTNSVAEEAQLGLGPALAEIQKTGGVVASFTTSTATGTTTGNKVWYTGDFEMADAILACSVQQGLVDARQVFTAGCSAGGLQAGAMVYGRSSYLAAAMPNSGGILGKPKLQDPAHVPALITTHGGAQDFVVISFAQTSATLDTDIAARGGFVVNCDHGGGHCDSPPEVIAAQWQFLKAHPFGVAPEPYAGGLPATFPSVCAVVP